MESSIVKIISVTPDKRFVIKKVWNEDAWRYRVFRESTILWLIWVGGWGSDSGGTNKPGIPTYRAPYFDTLEEAAQYCAKVKKNLLEG